MRIWKVTDRYNDRKIWIIKRYADGHYMANQEICGRKFYTAFQRITKDRWADILKEV